VTISFDARQFLYCENLPDGRCRSAIQVLGLRIKQPGETMKREDAELMPTEQETALKPPYQRLLSDAIRGIGDLFGRHDIVDAQRRIVERVLDDPAPPVIYEPGSRDQRKPPAY
jgi:glucose-6-phosphate 1-dehydrogenase